MVKKRRSWHFYVSFISLSVFILGYLLWNFTPLKDEVNGVLVKELQPYLGDSFLINDFSIGLNSVSFYGVRTTDPKKTFSLELEEIRFGLYPLKVLTHGPRPIKLVESVQIVSPNLTLFYSDQIEIKDDRGISLEQVFEEIITNLQRAPQIDHVMIVDGSIDLQMQQNRRFPLLSNLDGRVNYRANSNSVDLDLSGKFLGTENSALKLEGAVDFAEKSWLATLDLQECIINSNWPFWPFDFWQIENASLQGKVFLNSNSFREDSLSFSGGIVVNDFRTSIYDQSVHAPEFTFEFDRHTINILPFECNVEDGDGNFEGQIPNIFQPEADWLFTFRNYTARNLYKSHDIFEYLYEGKLKGSATIRGPFKNLDIVATMTSPNLLYAVVPFNRNRVELVYNTASKLLTFPEYVAYFFDFRTVGNGTIDFVTHQIDLDMESDIDVPKGYFSLLNRLNEGRIELSTTFNGDYTTKLFRGEFESRAISEDTVLVRAIGPYTLDDQLFSYELYTEEIDDAFSVKGVIENVFSDADFQYMNVKDFPVKKFTRNPILSKLMDDRFANFYFAGPYDNLSTKMKIVSQDDIQDTKLVMSTHIRNIFLDDQRFRGNFTANTYPRQTEGRFDVAFSTGGFSTQIEVPNMLSGDLFVGAEADDPFHGNINIAHFALENYLENSPGLSNIVQEGKLLGTMKIDGTVGNPDIDFDLQGADLIVNQVGYYDAHISGSLKDQYLEFEDLWLRLNGDSVMTASFNWNLQSDSINIKAAGSEIESNFLAETIFRDPDVVNGRLDYTLIARGTMDEPLVYGSGEIRDGRFRDNPFHTAYMTFEDSLTADGDFWVLKDHLAKIRRFVYMSEEDYTVEGNGFLSIDETGPIDFSLNVTGNILAEIPRFQPFFIDPECTGSLFARLKGSRNNFYFDQARLNILDGSIGFENTIPRVTGLRADAVLDDSTGFFKINYIEGLVDGNWARIANERQVTVEDTLLTPWRLQDFGIDFGVLTLETLSSGIPLSLYGLMEEGEYGFFAAYGKTPDEKFYFAGPPTSAVARGKLVMYDCRVTFPFIGMYDNDGEFAYDEEDRVLEFLMNMFWDVAVRPGNNNRYFVNIPGYVGEVFMDLNIDNSSPGMDFFGRFLVDPPSTDSTTFARADSSLYRDYFRVGGEVFSSRGRVEYLDVKFRVERFGAIFNNYEIYPEVYGTAYTTVRTDFSNIISYDIVNETSATNEALAASDNENSGFPLDVYLKLYVIDPITGKEVSKGRWEDFRFKLETRDDMVGETQEDVLAHLGYSFKNLQTKAGEVGLKMTENFFLRPLFRPIERQLERRLRLDYVRVRSSLTSNLFNLNFQWQNSATTFLNTKLNNNIDPALALLQSSELSLGKYLLKDVYLTYTGQLVYKGELVTEIEDNTKLGMNHTWGLEYRLLYNWLLEMEYSRFQFDPYYENIPSDFRIRLRHSFNF